MAENHKSMKFNILLSDYPQQCTSIANMIALWNTVERLFSSILGVLIGPSLEQSLTLYGSIESSRARLSFLKTAGEATLKSHPLLAQLNNLIAIADKSLGLRNRYAHAIYAQNEKGQLCRLDMRFNWIESQKGAIVVSVNDVEEAFQNVRAAYQQASAFYGALQQELPGEYVTALHETQRLRALLGQPNAADTQNQTQAALPVLPSQEPPAG